VRKNRTQAAAMVVLIGMLVFSMSARRTGRAASFHELRSQQSPASKNDDNAALKYFTDVELLNQDGQKMRLYTDLLKGKVIVIHSFFSTCSASCLPLMRNMQKLQTALGERVGNEVYLISISVDPTVDTPERLKDFARKNGAKPGWFFLTGDKTNVDFALHKVGQYVETSRITLT